jgi:hypothetical protein
MKHLALILIVAAILLMVVPAMAENPQDVIVAIENQSAGEHYQTTAHLVNGTYVINLAGIPNLPSQNATGFGIDPSSFANPRISYNVDEPITYPQEYYDLKTLSNYEYNLVLQHFDQSTYAELFDVYELRRQTILMEKQNELLQEQVNLMREQSGCGKV